MNHFIEQRPWLQKLIWPLFAQQVWGGKHTRLNPHNFHMASGLNYLTLTFCFKPPYFGQKVETGEMVMSLLNLERIALCVTLHERDFSFQAAVALFSPWFWWIFCIEIIESVEREREREGGRGERERERERERGRGKKDWRHLILGKIHIKRSALVFASTNCFSLKKQ